MYFFSNHTSQIFSILGTPKCIKKLTSAVRKKSRRKRKRKKHHGAGQWVLSNTKAVFG